MSRASIETYIKQIESGAVENNEAKVYKAISESGGITIEKLRHNMAHQTLTATVSSLQDIGIVYVNGIERTEDASYSKLYVETNPERIKSNRQNRINEKFKRWLKNGEKYYEFLDPFVSQSLMLKLEQLKNTL